MSLIERLKEFDKEIKGYTAPIDYVQYVNLDACLGLLPEIIHILDAQEKQLKHLFGTIAKMGVNSARQEQKLARQEKLLGEAKTIIDFAHVEFLNRLTKNSLITPKRDRHRVDICEKWLAALDEEGKK